MAEPHWRDQLRATTASVLPGTIAERWTLLGLLLLALVLRFWGFPHIPYTHDEISALVRVDFPTLGDAVRKGIWNIDTHPPATHAFLWCWTQLFGFGDGAVKGPFIVMSVAALFFLYRFAYAWAGPAAALVSTALLATLQYTVMYGQIARPYAMGLFTTALIADQLTRYIATGKRLRLAIMTLGLVLSAYTHHFALMLAAFMYLSGLLLVGSGQRKAFLVAGAVALVCYLPNLPLFFAQLGWKGLDEWLTPPSADWTIRYAWWIAHCSIVFALALGMVIGLAGALRIRHKGSSPQLWTIALVWGLLPLVVGYIYSLLRAPVLQYSVVLFSFPYLLIGMLGGLRHLRDRYAIGLSVALAMISVLSLVTDRKYYELFDQSKYEAIVRGTMEAERTGRLAVIDAPPEVVGFYRKLWCVNPSEAPSVNLRGRPAHALDSLLKATSATAVFYGQTSQALPENIARIQSRFPFMLERHDRVEGQTFVFAARPHGEVVKDIRAQVLRTPEVLTGEGWDVDPKILLVVDTVSSNYMPRKVWDFTGHEYGAVYDQPIYKLVGGPNDLIEVSTTIERADAACDLGLVVELKDGDRSLFYRSNQLTGALRDADGRITLITTVKLSDIPRHGDGSRLRTYLYNPARRAAMISALRVQVREGDPVLYGLYEPIVGHWTYR